MSAEVIEFPRVKGNGALEVVREFFDDVQPHRGNAKRDITIPDGDYFLLWLAERGFLVTPFE